jgi:NADH-quinone oxidoreductase subunit G
VPASWSDAVGAASELLESVDGAKILFVGSPHATVEDNYLLKRLAAKVGAQTPVFVSHVEEGSGDGWLVTEDRAPNAAGCRLLGLEEISAGALVDRIADAELVYVMEEDPIALDGEVAAKLETRSVILHYYNTTNHTLQHAKVAFPVAMAVETVGTMVNVDGIAQRLRPAKAIKTINRSLVMEMGKSRPDKHGTPFDRWHNEANTIDCKPSWDVLMDVAESAGIDDLRFKSPSAVFSAVSDNESAFKGLTYEAMGLTGAKLETTHAS